MDIYQLEYVLHEPQESEGGMYLAEIPALQGAMAWGRHAGGDAEQPPGGGADYNPDPQGGRRNTASGGNSPAKPQGNADRGRMTYRELRRKLELLGCRFQRQADGSHEIWVNPANGRRSPIPRHGNRDLATGTLHRIRRNLGISRPDFDSA